MLNKYRKNIRFFLMDFVFGIKKDCIFAPAKQSKRVLFQGWSGSSVWLECLPVTQEVASSSLVRTAQNEQST